MLPIYNEFCPQDSVTGPGSLLKDIEQSESNPGLLFDKFANGWSQDWGAKLGNNVKKNFFTAFARTDYRYLKSNLYSFLKRQEDLVCALCGCDASPLLYLKTNWRFVSGLGSGHPYETGFIWHRTLGVPYLPGSSIKGLIRAWVEQWCDMDEEIKKNALRLFGFGAGDGESTKKEAGALIVFDALPVRVPKLELDILNPHYSPYYQDSNHNPPADYYSPIPIFFLTVAPDQPFRFCLAPRPGAITNTSATDVVQGYELLEIALKTIGAGGKTAVGYGVFSDDFETINKIQVQRIKTCEKTLPKKDVWRREMERLKPDDLIIRFSRNWAKTKKRYGKDLPLYLQIVCQIHGDAIRTWQHSEEKNRRKAYTKIFPTG